METEHYKLFCVGEFTPDELNEYRANNLGVTLSLELESSAENALRSLCVVQYDAVLVHPRLKMQPDKFKTAVRSTHPFMVVLVPPRLPVDVIVQDLVTQMNESRIKIASHMIVGDLVFNPSTRIIFVQNRNMRPISENAGKLLAFMMNHPNRNLNRDDIHKNLDTADKQTLNYIDTLVSDLRNAVQLSRKVQLISVRGVGYKLQVS